MANPASAAPSDPELDALIGEVLGNGVRLVARLGAGGMGIVFRAWDHAADEYKVVKVPRRALLIDPKFMTRFHREMKAVRSLSHPHIIPILDVGTHLDIPYAVMPYMAGGSLKQRRPIQNNRLLPAGTATLHRWLRPIAAALDAVHGSGYVHRDVKPDNILFDGPGTPFLSDFGIAKIVRQMTPEEHTQSLTSTGFALGTPDYMAPELIEAGKADGRVDQYALAVAVYELLTARKPITAATPAAVMVAQVTQQAPPPEQFNPQISSTTSEAILRAMAKKPDQRFASCAEFADAVLAEVPDPPAPRKVRLLCPNCSNLISAAAAWAGKDGTCPACKIALHIAVDLKSIVIPAERVHLKGVGGQSRPRSSAALQMLTAATPSPLGISVPPATTTGKEVTVARQSTRWAIIGSSAACAVVFGIWSLSSLLREEASDPAAQQSPVLVASAGDAPVVDPPATPAVTDPPPTPQLETPVETSPSAGEVATTPLPDNENGNDAALASTRSLEAGTTTTSSKAQLPNKPETAIADAGENTTPNSPEDHRSPFDDANRSEPDTPTVAPDLAAAEPNTSSTPGSPSGVPNKPSLDEASAENATQAPGPDPQAVEELNRQFQLISSRRAELWADWLEMQKTLAAMTPKRDGAAVLANQIGQFIQQQEALIGNTRSQLASEQAKPTKERNEGVVRDLQQQEFNLQQSVLQAQSQLQGALAELQQIQNAMELEQRRGNTLLASNDALLDEIIKRINPFDRDPLLNAKIQALTDLHTASADFGECLLYRAMLYLLAGDSDKALADLKTIEPLLHNPQRHVRTGLGIDFVYASVMLGDGARARKCIRMVEKRFPNDPAILLLQGFCEATEGSPAKAAAAYKRALKNKSPHFRALLCGHAAWLFAAAPVDSVRDPKRSTECIQEALQLTGGKSWLAWRAQAALHAEEGRWDVAQECLAKARTDAPLILEEQFAEQQKAYEAKELYRIPRHS